MYKNVIKGNADINTQPNQCISPLVDYLLHFLAYLKELIVIKCLEFFDQSTCDCGWVKPTLLRQESIYCALLICADK